MRSLLPVFGCSIPAVLREILDGIGGGRRIDWLQLLLKTKVLLVQRMADVLVWVIG